MHFASTVARARNLAAFGCWASVEAVRTEVISRAFTYCLQLNIAVVVSRLLDIASTVTTANRPICSVTWARGVAIIVDTARCTGTFSALNTIGVRLELTFSCTSTYITKLVLWAHDIASLAEESCPASAFRSRRGLSTLTTATAGSAIGLKPRAFFFAAGSEETLLTTACRSFAVRHTGTMSITDTLRCLSRALKIASIAFKSRLTLAPCATSNHTTGTLVRTDLEIGTSTGACKGARGTKETSLTRALSFFGVRIEFALAVAFTWRDARALGRA